MEMINDFRIWGVWTDGERRGRMRRTVTEGRLRMRRDVFFIFFKGK